jgi:hypothetical protein
MKPTGHRRPAHVRNRAVRFGLGRAVAAAPATLGSLLLVTLESVAVGRWVGLLVPLAWAAGCGRADDPSRRTNDPSPRVRVSST